jgi:hypothetical protein
MNRRRYSFADFAILVRDLCQLRRSPQDVPYSTALLVLLIAGGIAIDVASGFLIENASNVLARSLLSSALVLSLCWIALAVRGLTNRYVQTATALAACGVAFSLLALPVVWMMGALPIPPEAPKPHQVLLGWAMLGLLLWSLAVNAHILRNALDGPFALGLALATAWAVADWALAHALFDAAS